MVLCAAVEFLVYDFTGDLEISLEDIPLRVEPATVPVTAKEGGTRVVLTFYGDESLGSRIYQGKIRFLAMTGGTVAMGIKVRATVTNLVEGETPVLATPEEPQPAQEAPAEEEEASTPEQEPSEIQATLEKAPEEELVGVEEPAAESPAPEPSPAPNPFPVLPVAGIAAGTAIVITLIVVWSRSRY